MSVGNRFVYLEDSLMFPQRHSQHQRTVRSMSASGFLPLLKVDPVRSVQRPSSDSGKRFSRFAGDSTSGTPAKPTEINLRNSVGQKAKRNKGTKQDRRKSTSNYDGAPTSHSPRGGRTAHRGINKIITSLFSSITDTIGLFLLTPTCTT